MHRNLITWTLGLLVVAALGAQAAETPAVPGTPTAREAYDRAVSLFASGHLFSAEEFGALEGVRSRLEEAGDADLAASLDLLRQAASSAAAVQEAQAQAAATLRTDRDELDLKDRLQRDRGFWRGLRDVGLFTFSVATVSSLLIAFTLDRNEALLHGSNFSDGTSRAEFNNRLGLGLLGSTGTMLFSLFPLLWGEARQ